MRIGSSHLKGTAMAGLFLLSMAFAAPASAQRFQHMFGGDCNEYGFSGIHTRDGGYISVGSSFTASSSGETCRRTHGDIYIVKQNANGSLAWSRTIDIAEGNDFARDVVESFATEEGGYLITGWTDRSGCDNMGGHDIVLLKIDNSGNLVWLNTYGTQDHEELAFRLVECRYSESGDAGEIAVAGYRYIDNTRYDGVILRTNASGGIIFFKTYGGDRDDGLFGIIEAQMGDNAGDLVAAGFSDSYNSAGVTEGLALRVDLNGRFYGSPSSAAVYGRENATRLSHVAELTYGDERGRLVFCGDADFDGTATDPYFLKTEADPCRRVADIRWGDNDGNSHEETWSIREIRDPNGTGLIDGDLIVAGLTEVNGTTEAYMLELDPALSLVSGLGFKVYNATVAKGYTAYPVLGSSTSTAGFHLVATALNINGNNDLQMYVVKTDNTGDSYCYYRDYDPRRTEPGFEPECPELNVEDIGEVCRHEREPVRQDWAEIICNDVTSDPWGKLSNGNRGDGKLDIYPNPVKAGTMLKLSTTMREAGKATVVISDMSGRVIHNLSKDLQKGDGAIEVSTNGWSSGTYVVKITADGRSTERRIVVAR